MRRYFFLLLGLVAGTIAQAQISSNEETLVRRAIENYINGRNQGQAALLREAFHPAADLRSAREDTLHIWPAADYIGGVKAGNIQNCQARIVYVDIAGNAAQAKVEIEYPNWQFADYLNLLKIEGTWRIAVKSYAGFPVPAKKVLFVLTSHERMGETGRKTGMHLGEVSHVYKPLHDAGFGIDFVSPQGGETFMYGASLTDSLNRWMMQNASAYYALTHAQTPAEIDPMAYTAIYFVGGHGTMWDLPEQAALQKITRQIYENGGVVAAICHGPSGLLNTKLSDGSYLIQGKQMTSFSDAEERSIQQAQVVPFLLESTLRARGATVTCARPGEAKVVIDGRLVTGQNPASAYPMAQQLIKLLQAIELPK